MIIQIILGFDGFPVNIWGTVAEVSAAIFTGITGILLFITFREQRSTTRIQLQKFKYDIRPKFIISQSSGKAFCIDSKSDWSIHYQMELIDNAAFDIWLVTVSGFENSTVLVKRQLENFSPGRKFEILNGMLPKEEIQRQIAIRVYFKDEAENQYYQLLHGDIRDLQIDVPIEVAKRKSLIARWLFK